MSYRAKQATVALNLLAIAMVGLLYRMDSADDHIADQKAYSGATTSELTSPKDETMSPLLDTGIKMVGIDLPAPPPVVVAGMTSTEVIPATSNVPAVKQNVTMQPEIQSKPALIPMKVSIASPQPNPALKKSLAKPETLARPPKTLLKSEILTLALPNVTSKTPDLQPLSSKKVPSLVAISSGLHAIEVTSQEALVKARVGRQKLPSSQSDKDPSLTPLMPKPSRIAPPSEIHIHQANLLRGQQTLNKLIGEGGLDMEIFWPPTAQQSEYLYKVMTQCFGMQSAVIDNEGDLFFASGKDRGSRTGFSPLLRKIMQPASRDEVSVINEIVKRNAISDSYTPVRIFSKLVDARLVDGVTQMTGKVIHPQSVLRANYVIDQGQVYIANITHDGILSSGRLLLANGGC
ncbi:hypothetical protein OAJ84_03455 [Candidatus Puniceispirillum sp.]|nr:hypothetical protein [Candidatus Puniceispirillum sp.]